MGEKRGTPAMGKYTVYRLDGAGKIRAVEWLDALDDRYALEGARAIAETGGCEVWQLDRKIGRVTAIPDTPIPGTRY
jgi:hypothetical protein